jgi:signal transduction histidine kinase
MMSATAMLEARGTTSSADLRGPELIIRSGLRMEHIISDLLDFTRSHLGSGIPIRRVDMDLEKICRQTVDEIAAFHPHRELRFDVTGHVRGRWDSDRVAQVLSNLLGNAIQHSSKDSPIRVSLSGHRDHVSIAVHNWGPPIPPNRLGDIFSPMRRAAPEANQSRRLSSLGLGLFIAKEVARAHGGTIDVESTSDHGTCFTVRLPRVRDLRQVQALQH